MEDNSTYNLSIPTTIPRQKISTSAKTDEWGKDNILYWENRLINKNTFNTSDKIKMKKNCNLYYHNILDNLEVARICNPYNIKDFQIPLDFRHYKIENPKIQTLKGEELKRRFEWKVYVSNRDAISEKEEQKKEQYFQFITEKIKSESFDEETAKKELQKLSEYLNYDWQELRERTADELLHHYVQYLDLKTQFSRAWEHSLINGEDLMSIDEHNGKPVIEACDPKTIYWLKSPENPYIDDSDAVVRAYYVPLGQIIDYYYEDLTSTQISELEDRQTKRTEYEDFTLNQYYHKSDEGFFMPNGTNGELVINTSNFEGYYDEDGNIRIVHVRWKSLRKIGRLFYFDEQGEEQEKFVDENYKIDKSKGERVEWIWITEAWEGTRIGEDIFIKIKPRNVQFRKLDNQSYCSLGYVGTKIDNAFFDLMKDYSIKYDAYMWRTEDAMKKALGKIAILDLAMIPDEMDLDTWIHFATNMGWAIKDSFKEGKKGAAQGKLAGSNQESSNVINLEQGQFIQQNMMMLQYIETQLDKIIGINPQRQGVVSQDAGLQVTREASQASSNITESYYAIHDNVKLRTLRALLEVAKWCLREKKESIQYITSEMTSKIFELDGQLINEADFGILVGDATNDAKTIAVLQEAFKMAAQTGEIDPIQLMDIFSNDNTASIKRKIEKSVNEKKQQEQKRFEDEQKQIADQRQHEAQLHQEELDDKKSARQLKQYEIDQNNQTKITVAEIGNYFKAADTDNNNNGIPDPMEIASHALEQTRLQSDILHKNLVEGSKLKQHNDKVNLEKEKLNLESKKFTEEMKQKAADRQIEKQNMKNDLTIARVNASNRKKQNKK